MDAAGLGYTRRENCFTDLEDVVKSQALMDRQLTTDWRPLLDSLAAAAHPAHAPLFGPDSAYPIDPYWSVQQSEWATDVMFKRRAQLAALYPRLIRQGMETLGSRDVLRFLGRRVPDGRNAHHKFTGQVVSDLKDRPEGMRVKHAVKSNSVKMYDKQGTVLRVETTINQTREFKVYRGTETEPENKQWRKLRKGVADLHRRAEVSQASNTRYLESMAAVEQPTTLEQSLAPLCRPVTWQGRRARALRPFDAREMQWIQAMARGEFAINGFRNHDLREIVLGCDDPKDPAANRRRAGQATRQLRLLRAHGVIRKVPRTHRYVLSDKGRTLATLLIAAKNADTQQLTAIAA
jgi:hypothetical protein